MIMLVPTGNGGMASSVEFKIISNDIYYRFSSKAIFILEGSKVRRVHGLACEG